MTKFIEDVPGQIIVLEQFVAHNVQHPRALVQCPTCGHEFLKARGGIQRSGHTICQSCVQRSVPRSFIEPIEDIPGLLIIIEQRVPGEQHCTALVECPFCGDRFLKRRSHIRSGGHTACRRCVCQRLRSSAIFIEDIPDELIILEQFIGRVQNDHPMCLAQCPDCGQERAMDRGNVLARQTSRCQACGQSGERHWNWTGGYSPNYGCGWAATSDAVMERDGQTCQLCGGVGADGRLHVHHIVPYRETQDNSPQNLITLCPACHCWADHHLDESVPTCREIIDTIYDTY